MSTDVELWPLRKLRAAQQVNGRVDTDANDPIAFTIPSFQRSLVWPESKQQALVSSIIKGLPYGAILLVKHKQQKQITLLDGSSANATNFGIIDGLQRTNAIAQHLRNSLRSVDGSVIRGRQFDQFAADLEYKHDVAIDRDRLADATIGWMQSVKRPDMEHGYGAFEYVAAISRAMEIKLNSIDDMSDLTHTASVLLSHVRSTVDISESKIPVMIYSGPTEYLPDIFEQINRAGTMLSKYEIYAASWVTTRVEVAAADIRDSIARRYERLENEGFTVEEAHEGAVYTLFEYLHGLSQALGARYPSLFSGPDADEGKLSSAFPIATLMFGRGLDQMGGLNEFFPTATSGGLDVAGFEKALFEAADVVQVALAPYLSFRFTNTPQRVAHSDLQMVSMVAAVASNLFDHSRGFEHRRDPGDAKALRMMFERTLPQHYLYDIIRDYWRGSLYSYALERVWQDAPGAPAGSIKTTPADVYLRHVDERSFRNAMSTSLSEQLANDTHDRKNIRAVDRVLLKFIYAHRVTVAEQATHKFDVEHWIPVRRIQAMTKGKRAWPIGALGNLGVLPAGSNRVKKDQTLYEYLHRSSDGPSGVEADLIQKLSLVDVDLVQIPNHDGHDAMTREGFVAFVSAAWTAMEDELVKVLSISPTHPSDGSE